MRLLFILLVFAFPIVEILVFIRVCASIGIVTGISLTLLTAILGIFCIKRVKLNAISTASQALRTGKFQLDATFSMGCKGVGAALIILPGFITDFLGALFFIPLIQKVLLKWLEKKFSKIDIADKQTQKTKGKVTLEGEFREII